MYAILVVVAFVMMYSWIAFNSSTISFLCFPLPINTSPTSTSSSLASHIQCLNVRVPFEIFRTKPKWFIIHIPTCNASLWVCLVTNIFLQHVQVPFNWVTPLSYNKPTYLQFLHQMDDKVGHEVKNCKWESNLKHA